MLDIKLRKTLQKIRFLKKLKKKFYLKLNLQNFLIKIQNKKQSTVV